MSGLIVMVIYAKFIEELRRTGVADPVHIPMLCVVHVLHYSSECWKALVTRMAFVITHLESVSCYWSSKLKRERKKKTKDRGKVTRIDEGTVRRIARGESDENH